MFVRNAWYVAGFAHDLKPGQIQSRTFLGERVAMYRKADGSPAALYDRCPHRFVPLAIGKVKGDIIQCGYHGLEFGADGACTHNPHGDGKIASNMKVKAYPMAEQDGILWIWMGEAGKADPSTIQRFPQVIDPRYKTVFGYMNVEAAYQLINDNLLDLSHAAYVHPIFWPTDLSLEPGPREGEFGEDRGSVWINLTQRKVSPSRFNSMFDDRMEVENWVNTQWYAPSLVYLDIGTRAVGAEPGPDDVETPSMHLLTPETETSTHYFWTMIRNVRLENEALSAEVHAGFEEAFAKEDKPIIEMQQREIGDRDLMEMRPVLLQTDTPAIRARRIIEAMLKAEA